ncbi:MAG TPA: recombination mediator RecR [Chlamydiales bacterium]|nr:recombination mediator RecR [Chlamydiales bacterium]
MANRFPEDLLTLIAHLKKLPGVGTRTAERFAFEFLHWPQDSLTELGHLLTSIQEKIPPCPTCGCLTHQGACYFCNSPHRDPTSLCILASPRDAYAIEETQSFRGLYHVIEHLLSPLDGRNTQTLRVDRILSRIQQHNVREAIIAFDATLEGDTTALFLKSQLARPHLTISRLALGLPIGTNLEYIDSGTLGRALTGRQQI